MSSTTMERPAYIGMIALAVSDALYCVSALFGTCLLQRVNCDVAVMRRIPPPIGARLSKCLTVRQRPLRSGPEPPADGLPSRRRAPHVLPAVRSLRPELVHAHRMLVDCHNGHWTIRRHLPTTTGQWIGTIVMFLHYLTLHTQKKTKIYVVFLSIVWVAQKRTDLVCKWLWKDPVVRLDHSMCFSVRSDVPLPLRVHAPVFATGQWLLRWFPEKYGPKRQCFSSSMSRFRFCVMSGSVET